MRFKSIYVSQIPVPEMRTDKGLDGIVRRILDQTKDDPAAEVADLERELDERVYRLYGLTQQEIALVEGTAE